MSVGLWPACADNENKGEVIVCSILYNLGIVGMPTLTSLLFEPFRDYRERTPHGLEPLDFGLIGFNKYYRDCRKDETRGFLTESTKNLTSYELFGFTVMIDGERYEDKD